MADYFDDAGDSPEPINAEPEMPDESEEATAVLPRSFFEAAGKEPEPGETCRIRVLSAGEDSVEVAYEREEPEPELEEAPAPPSEMAGYMEA